MLKKILGNYEKKTNSAPLSEDFPSEGFKISVTAILIRRRAIERRYLQYIILIKEMIIVSHLVAR